MKFLEAVAETDEDFDRIEELVDRREFLLSNVVLNQNPNNVFEWLNRVKLCEGDVESVIATFTLAIQRVDAEASLGSPALLWIEFATFYEKYGELQNANYIFHTGSKKKFAKVEELSQLMCSWAEMHIRHGNLGSSVKIMQHATTKMKELRFNTHAWQLYIDLLESDETS